MTFEKLFNIIESNTAGAGGCFGDSASTTWSADGSYIDYAPNDSRVPKVLGKKRSKKGKKSKTKILRRNGK